MSVNPLFNCPPQLKPVQHYLKLAIDYEGREPAITYWARFYGLQSALKLDRKSPDAKVLLSSLMDWLEKFKKEHADNEAVTSDVAGQAVLENEANKLFEWADSNDRAAIFNKNVVKSFYTVGVILDVCEIFGEVNEEVAAQRKYAKWKATYIHNCLKQGQTPAPGPIGPDGQPIGDRDRNDNGLQSEFTQPVDHEEPFAHLPQPSTSSILELPPGGPPQIAGIAPVDASSPAHRSQVRHISTVESGVVQPKHSVPYDTLKQVRKCCKWADSALEYEDVTCAVENLQKALTLLLPYHRSS